MTRRRALRLEHSPGMTVMTNGDGIMEPLHRLSPGIGRVATAAPAIPLVGGGADRQLAALGAGRDIERLTGGVTSAALLIAGALLGTTSGWHRVIGDLLLAVGIVGTVAVALGALLKRRAQ